MFESFVSSALVKVDKWDKDKNTVYTNEIAKDFLWVALFIEIM